MAGCLIRTGDESVTLSGPAVRALLARGDGDAALLYIALLRHNGTVMPRSLAGEMRWSRERIEAAESVLRELELIAPDSVPPEPADEHPDYTPEDISARLEDGGEFRSLTAEVERKLGKRLSTPDVAALLGLYDYLGLPADVIYLLVSHCTERLQRRFGAGRRPTLRQIEKEGYAWARMGIDSQTQAAAYLKKYNARIGKMPEYMRVLQLGDRAPSPSEEKYLNAWQEWGFGPEVVAAAYDRTILRCHELKWPYLNGILRRWNTSGLHTLQEIEAGDRPSTARKQPDRPPQTEEGWMRQYAQNLRKERGE
ncbi:MAG: DnaD domain protein [Oscillibacter sp.]|jgi:DnaD/phage-associated family protein|nr:DnaD domain protein [Oscillibacter sp.]